MRQRIKHNPDWQEIRQKLAHVYRRTRKHNPADARYFWMQHRAFNMLIIGLIGELHRHGVISAQEIDDVTGDMLRKPRLH
jgi:hypothetical protein